LPQLRGGGIGQALAVKRFVGVQVNRFTFVSGDDIFYKSGLPGLPGA
jgi:hypothetical protein